MGSNRNKDMGCFGERCLNLPTVGGLVGATLVAKIAEDCASIFRGQDRSYKVGIMLRGLLGGNKRKTNTKRKGDYEYLQLECQRI